MASLSDRLGERQAKKDDTKKKAAMLGGELDALLQATKERQAAVSGEKPAAPYSLYMTLFAYKSDDPDDLQFEAGEILRVTDDSDEWYEGENQQGQKGTFPHNFVRKIKAPAGEGSVALGGMEHAN